jgi:hypothetical protein
VSHFQVHSILKDLVRKAINETHVSFLVFLSYYYLDQFIAEQKVCTLLAISYVQSVLGGDEKLCLI